MFFYKIKKNQFEDEYFQITFVIFLHFDDINVNFEIIINNENFSEFQKFVYCLNNDKMFHFFYEEDEKNFIAININEEKQYEIYITEFCFINKIKNKQEFVKLFNDIKNDIIVLLNI